MPKRFSIYTPILIIFTIQSVLLYWIVATTEKSIYELATPYSIFVSTLMLLLGILPAFLRPQTSHVIIACFSITFAFFLLIPFEANNLPEIKPNIPLYTFLNPEILSRLINAALIFPLMIHITAYFPRRNNISKKYILGAYILSFVLLGIFLNSYTAIQRSIIVGVLFLWLTAGFIFFIFTLIKATQHENQKDAQRARIVLFSVLLAQTPLWLRPLTLIFQQNIMPYNWLLTFQLFMPIGITYAILKHDLFDIDRVVRRALVYGTASLLLLTLYLALTTSITSLFADSLNSRPLIPIISLLISAILFEPTRKLTQTWLDKLLYPDRLKFQTAIQEIQTLLTHTNRREEITTLLNEVLPKKIGAEWGSVKLFPEPDVPPANLTPAWSSRLVAGNVSFGGYWLGARVAAPDYDGDEKKYLQILVGQASFALAYSNAYESLYQLNQTLEERVKEQTEKSIAHQKSLAAYEERQKIARDLHDSVSQSLFGIHLMARGLASKATNEIKTDLQMLETQAQVTLKEMRLLLNQLRNVSVEENVDVTESIRNMCEAFSQRRGPEGGSLLNINLNLSQGVVIPKYIADEVVWVIREALQNIIKHSQSRIADIEIKKEESLQIMISDDGVGFDVKNVLHGHYGLQGMRERVLKLGGEFTIESQQGTVIKFSIPIPR
jgi:signal transduction histidine kinase